MNEVGAIIKRLKNGKASGKDGLTTELFKHLDEESLVIITLTAFSYIIKKIHSLGLIIPIHKNGSTRMMSITIKRLLCCQLASTKIFTREPYSGVG